MSNGIVEESIVGINIVDKKIGFIGCGNMGKAILGGLVASKLVPAENITVYNRSAKSVEAISQEFGSRGANSADEVAKEADVLIVGVKPNMMANILGEIRDALKPNAIIVSIAAGVTLETLEFALKDGQKVVRVMPNTPALVNAGMSSITPNKQVSEDESALIVEIFSSFGRAEIVPEYLIHSVVGVSGSAPAYVFMFIEAMADAAVLGGMPRAQAYQFAAQAVMGSAKMVLETGKHPGELKDMVCSPGGTTIEAVKVLEQKGLRAAVMDAMQSCMAKSEEMSRR
ncbi:MULTISPECIES: pyrroline-5-carboxylate reductase [Hafnia]|jgi:pyrroline-5-carboxylate reductase|uniref:pyrroline-5-carboxylate reductase n=1 Tax=Hafnia TaxID=568 RepID=UPI0001F065AD|nr:pyrroline-5-carboxylate reductase [Hafnia paralvei]MDU1191978.1 pyrroline-5-carboxylate reductase [Enterobacteriaceae bacterium]MBU2673521.1 pyrroline-5-carboxylate reductase [Hafnia paralvei]MBW2957739.1 pyrroline-5-carboxylate reductase [Hafnia paralvei]MDU1243881.1 pyrroline-5-carboxylate reductase [Enterobacteriaceae bacterium]MDX6840558.1 pyrroline-5-carboxylate reductase [Hafnia paralvei]